MQQSIHSSSYLTYCYLHITINNIEIRHNKPFDNVYFSFLQKNRFYFSSTLSHQTPHVNDDILILFEHEDQVPDFIKLQRWENHMILLQTQVDLAELKNRYFTKKKIQTKHNQIISLTIHLYTSQQINFFTFPVTQIVQHYLKINKLTIHGIRQSQNDFTNFHILTKQGQKYTLPVINSQVVINLPTQIQIAYLKNGQVIGKTDWLKPVSDLNSQILQFALLNQKRTYISKVRVQVQWGTNLSYRKFQSSILYQANELCIYDIEVKFQNFSQFANTKLKFVYGNKGFQLNGELNHRIVMFQRIIYMILKYEEEQILVVCQKMNKVIALAKFNTADILSHKVVTIKKYLTDPVSHRPLGYVKFLCERAKNLSLPSSNNFWKQLLKKKHSSSKLSLKIQQLSVESQSKKPLFVIIKTEKQQYEIDPIINISNSQIETPVHEPLLVSIQQRLSMYMVIKQKQEPHSTTQESDFLGIAAINYDQLRLGSNPVTISFFKNQQLTVEANCIINKVVPYPFVKGVLQNQINISSHVKNFSITINIMQVKFDPYFYSFQYENKTDIYCIFQVGKIKKVVLLQRYSLTGLDFQIGNQSDDLNFSVAENDLIKVKLTFLVSSLGFDQQIYGWTTFKVKPALFLQSQLLKFPKNEIKNDQGIYVGDISIQIKKGKMNSSQLMSNKEIKKIKKQMMKVNQNIQKVQRSFSKNKSIFLQQIRGSTTERANSKKSSLPVRHVSRKGYSPQLVKLPKI